MFYKKKFWVVVVGEPLPIKSGQRLLRGGILSEMLAARGHDVTWWTSTVDHYQKELYHPGDGVVSLNDNLRLNFLHGGLYKKNISLRRMINHIRIANKFKIKSASLDRPDIIVVSCPTIELSLAAVHYGNQHKVPVIVDFRDLWPDIFYETLPKKLRWLISPLIYYYNTALKKIVNGADSIISITEECRDWALSKGSHSQKEGKVFYLSYKSSNKTEELNQERDNLENAPFRVCFFGTFSNRLDLETVYQAAEHLKNDNVEFILCGQVNAELQKRINKNEVPRNINFPGYIGADEIKSISSKSNCGILPYHRDDFQKSVPNKVGEYLSSGLPILYCLEGTTDYFLKKNNCGIFYNSGDSKDLCDKIRQIKNNNSALTSMRYEAIKAYNQHLNSDSVYGDYCDYIERLAESKKII